MFRNELPSNVYRSGNCLCFSAVGLLNIMNYLEAIRVQQLIVTSVIIISVINHNVVIHLNVD